jgi:hypothetical protein
MSGSLPQVPNYLPNIQSPFAAAVQGLQVGQAFGEAASAEQQRASMQSAMQAFQRDPSSRTLTPLLTSLPPQTAEVLRKHWEGMETGQRESNIAFGGQAMSAILAGRTDLAGDLFMQRATAFENAGRADEAKFNRDMAELMKVNPQFALAFGASTLGTSEGGERMLRNILAARGAPTAERTAVAGARRAEAQATTEEAQSIFAGERAAVEVEKLQAEIEEDDKKLAYSKNTLEYIFKKDGDKQLIEEKINESQILVNEEREKLDQILKDLGDYSKQRLDKLNGLMVKALDAAKTILGTKDFNELYIDVQEIGKDLTLAMDSVEKDYWNHIKDYITLYLNGEEEDEPGEPE